MAAITSVLFTGTLEFCFPWPNQPCSLSRWLIVLSCRSLALSSYWLSSQSFYRGSLSVSVSALLVCPCLWLTVLPIPPLFVPLFPRWSLFLTVFSLLALLGWWPFYTYTRIRVMREIALEHNVLCIYCERVTDVPYIYVVADNLYKLHKFIVTV